jgi:PAS domain S-box-containing protein
MGPARVAAGSFAPQAGTLRRATGTLGRVFMAEHRTAPTATLTDLLFEKVGVGLCLVAPDGTVLRANDEWLRATGFTAEQVLGEDIVELFPEARDMALAMHARARAGHRVEVSRHALTVNGRETWWDGTIDPVAMAGGTGLLITAREVTQSAAGVEGGRPAPRGPAREMARIAELRAVADQAPVAVYVKDSEGRYVFANRWVAELFGRSPEDIVGRTTSDILPREVAERTRVQERRVASGERVVTEDAVPTPTGEHVLLTVRFPFSLGGGHMGTCGIAVDITDRKRAEEALRRSDARSSAVSNNIRDHLVLLEARRGGAGDIAEWRYVHANEGAVELLGTTRERLIGRTVREVLGERARAAEERLYRVLATGTAERYEAAVGEESLLVTIFPVDANTVGSAAVDITERKRSEDALRESEARYRTLFESIDEGFCIIEVLFEDGVPADYRFLEVNPAFEKHTGLVDAVGKRARELLPRHEEHWFQTYGRVALTGEPIRFENRAEAMGRNFDVFAFRVGAPESRRVAVLFTDVSERKRAQEALRGERDFATAVLDTVANFVVVLDPEGSIVRFNGACERATGYSVGEVLGRAFFDIFIPEDDLPGVRSVFQRLRAGDFPNRHQNRWRMRDGSERLFEWANTCIVDERGVVKFIIATGSDITERVKAEQTLRESEARFRAMGETLPYGVWLCNARGGAEYVSQSFLDLLEMTQEQQREFGWTHRLPPEDVEPTMKKWLRCVATGEMWDSEHRVLGPDGEYHHVLTRGLPVRDESGRITCWVGINLDIDNRKQIEQQLREADRHKTEFLALLSHELRNPLAPIRNSIHLLERAAPGSEQAARARAVVRRQAEHLTRLVDDLLDVTRISRGKIELQRRRLDLREVVRKTSDDLRSLFEQSGVELSVEDTAGPVWVDADATRIAQALGNLLHNAVKFTPAGGLVHVSVASKNARAVLSVRDNGLGIEPNQIDRMFEPFVQADNGLARAKGGLGLGLGLVKGLVELHGGSVQARSDGIGSGAEFIVTLPLSRGGEASDETRTGAVGERRVILVIEDNIDAGQSLAEVLELAGHRVRVARDGRSGVDLARELRPDVVLCDIGLPDLDGYDIARALRADDALRATRLVALSGYAQPEDRQRARDAGFDAHIPKPPDFDELMKVLANDS